MSRCKWHVGDVGPFEPVTPCGQIAMYDVRLGYRDRNGFERIEAACFRHAKEAQADGCEVDGLEDDGGEA